MDFEPCHSEPLATNGNLHLRKAGINVRIKQLQLEQVSVICVYLLFSESEMSLLSRTQPNLFSTLMRIEQL